MKYYFLIFLSIISLNSHSYAENYCESLTYTKIKTHLIKCSFRKIDLENSNLEEFSINNQTSTLFVSYKDIDKTLYILAVIRNVKLYESYKINLFDLEFQNSTFRNKGFAKLKESFNITDKINLPKLVCKMLFITLLIIYYYILILILIYNKFKLYNW